MSETPSTIVIESREHLISLLDEAAEVEHNLMCCYLYAAFSLKESADEDLTERELDAVRRWRRAVMRVAIDEMTHLALVANLTSAIGGVPHFGRGNFPLSAGYLPAGIVVKLAPFSAQTLDHFIYLERPDEAHIADGAGFAPARLYQRLALPGKLMPTSHDYDTIGALYRAIEDGLVRLAARDGEAALFVGDPAHQLGADTARLPGLSRVRCAKTARAALEGIVTQGEGAPGHSEESHYARFLEIRRELDELRAARPEFVPARPAAHNPVMRLPVVPEDRIWVSLQPAADLLDLVNAAYILMLRLLAQGYAETRGAATQRALIGAGIDLMGAIAPLASALTRLPASPDHPGCTAGMSFAMVRAWSALPSGPAADDVLVERIREIAQGAGRLDASGASTRLAQIAADLAGSLAAAPAAVAAPAPVAAAAPAPVDGVETVEGAALTLRFEAKRCIHARHCVLGEPGVFKANVQGPWLDPDATSADALVRVAHACPSGAITFIRKDGGADETAPRVNLIQVRERGPLGLRGDLSIDGTPIGFRATLCRCGGSKRKPFCDGTHATIGFDATGEPATRPSEPLARRDGPVDIRPQPNGPLLVRGNLEVCAGTGRTVDRLTEVRLCRCGGSANKPFCDGTHLQNGFRS